MKKIAILLLALMLSATCWAQTATVIELSTSDAAKAKAFYDVKKKADADWDQFRESTGRKIGLFDFDFSPDFRFAVPVTGTPIVHPCNWITSSLAANLN